MAKTVVIIELFKARSCYSMADRLYPVTSSNCSDHAWRVQAGRWTAHHIILKRISSENTQLTWSPKAWTFQISFTHQHPEVFCLLIPISSTEGARIRAPCLPLHIGTD